LRPSAILGYATTRMDFLLSGHDAPFSWHGLPRVRRDRCQTAIAVEVLAAQPLQVEPLYCYPTVKSTLTFHSNPRKVIPMTPLQRRNKRAKTMELFPIPGRICIVIPRLKPGTEV
jgi:hypothetical protein